MYKEIITIFIIIVLIISLDIASNNYTKKCVSELSENLGTLREKIILEDKESSLQLIKEVKTKWEEKYNVMAYYIEHDELEKVETELTGLSADIDVEEYDHCVSRLDTIIFILQHIEDKEKFSIQSIF